MISTADLHWTAGFLDGEGCFQISRGTAIVSANQKYSPSLEKLLRLYGGGRVKFYQYGKRSFYVWSISGPQAAGLMMTLYPLLSPYRQNKIEQVLKIWRCYPPKGQWSKVAPRDPKTGRMLRAYKTDRRLQGDIPSFVSGIAD